MELFIKWVKFQTDFSKGFKINLMKTEIADLSKRINSKLCANIKLTYLFESSSKTCENIRYLNQGTYVQPYENRSYQLIFEKWNIINHVNT